MLSFADADIVRRDPEVPGLAVLLDSDRFAQTLRDLLPEARIDSVQNTYVRYKRSLNCLAVYQVRAAGKATQVYAFALGRGMSDKLYKSSQIPQVPGALGLGVLVLDEFNIVISCLPNDRGLRAVRRLTNDKMRKHILRHAVPDRHDLWDGELRELRYKPRRRYVGQLLVDHEPRSALKVYAKDAYKTALEKARLFASQEAFCAARLVGHSDRHHITVFKWLPGRQLFEMLLETQGEEVPGIEEIGASLGRLYRLKRDTLPTITREDEATRLREAANELGVVCPHLHDDAHQLADHITNRLISEPPVHATVHGDFYAKQVLIDRGKPAFVDLDEAAIGDPASDLGRFTAHLEYLAVCGDLPADRVDQISIRLLQGYLCDNLHNPTPRLPLYQAAELLRLATQPFRYRHHNWPSRAEAVLRRAQEVFSSDTHQGNPWPSSRHNRPDSVQMSDPFGTTGDPAMGFLEDALNPAAMRLRLEQLVSDRFGSTSKIDLQAIRVTRHKPGRRCLVEYDLNVTGSDGGEEQMTWIGKARAKGLDRTTYDLVGALWNNGFHDDSDDGISVPEPIGMIPEYNMWLQRKVQGHSATELLPKPGSIELARRLADAIYKLHQTSTGAPTRRRHMMNDELTILQDRLATVAQEQPRFKRRLSHILAACNELARTVAEPKTTGIHRDFYADQVIVNGSRLYLIDLDLYCQGDPALDIGNFIGHLTEQSVRMSGHSKTLADREAVIADRYLELAGQDVWHAVQAYQALTLVRHIYLSTRFDDRQPFTECLIALCEDRLHGERSHSNHVACYQMNEATG